MPHQGLNWFCLKGINLDKNKNRGVWKHSPLLRGPSISHLITVQRRGITHNNLFNFSFGRTCLNLSNGFRAFSLSLLLSCGATSITYRLYSTNVEDMNGKNLKKSIKANTFIFKNLTSVLLNHPINEETQMMLEELLSSFAYTGFKEKLKSKNLGIIDYSVFNPKLAEIFIKVKPTLITTINNFHNDYPNHFMTKLKKKEKNDEYYLIILKS